MKKNFSGLNTLAYFVGAVGDDDGKFLWRRRRRRRREILFTSVPPFDSAQIPSNRKKSYKTFYVRNLSMLVKSLSVFVPGRPFQHSKIFVAKFMSLPDNGAPKRYFTWVGSELTQKHWTRLERLARHKHSSLLPIFVYYIHYKFCNIELRSQIYSLLNCNSHLIS